jgi:hypothetical protein
MIELSGRDAGSLLDLGRRGKTLSSERITTEEPPPAFLQIEPARSCGNEDVMEARMLSHPGPRLSTVVAGKIVCDDVNVPAGIVGFDALKQRDIVGRVPRSCAERQFLAVAHAQRSIDPRFLGAATVIQQCLDAVTSGRPAWSGRKAAWDDRPKFIGADGRRSFYWSRVVDDDRCPFGAKSGSLLVPQLCVWRQRTPSRSKIVRI